MHREASMRRYFKVLPLLGALLAACSSPSPVDEIVASNLAARGGKERIQALRAIRETGTVTASGGRVAKVVREIKRPGLFRLEFTYEGTKSVFANDGQRGWQVAPLQGQFEPQAMPPETDAAAGVDQRDIEGSLVNWREKGHVVELVGRETLPGGEASKLKVALKGGDPLRLCRRRVAPDRALRLHADHQGAAHAAREHVLGVPGGGRARLPAPHRDPGQGPAPGPQDRHQEDRSRPRARRRAVSASPVAPRPHRSCRLVRHLVRHSDTSV